MKKLGLLMLAVLMISLSSCGGDDATKENDGAKDAKQEVKQEAPKQDDAATKEDAGKESAAAEFTTGEAFFKQNCSMCHKPDKDNTYPSVKKIAAIYKDKKEDLVKFLKGEGKAVVEPKRYESEMKPNLAITKALSDENLGKVADYMLSVK